MVWIFEGPAFYQHWSLLFAYITLADMVLDIQRSLEPRCQQRVHLRDLPLDHGPLETFEK